MKTAIGWIRREVHEPRNPIVSHAKARIRALAAFQASRRSAKAAKA